MIDTVRHWFRVRATIRREKKKEKLRSPHWSAFRDAWKKTHPDCQGCGSFENIQVHHVIPFSKAPAEELSKSNVMSMCMGKNECHLRIAHAGAFAFYNPHVRAHCELLKHNPAARHTIEATAKAGRLRDVIAK